MVLPKPVGACRNGVRLSSRLERVDLSGVQPRQWQPCSTKEGDVSEKTDCSTLRRSDVKRVDVLRDQTSEHQHHGQTLTDCACKEQLTATNVLDQPPGRCCEDGIYDHVDTAEDQGHRSRLAEGVLEQDWEIVDHGIAATDLSN